MHDPGSWWRSRAPIPGSPIITGSTTSGRRTFARTVDIHRKPGYDPVELFLDPSLAAPKAKIGWKLLQKTLGFRYLMDVIPLDPSLVRGSHGRVTDRLEEGPVFLSSEPALLPESTVEAAGVKELILDHLFR
jgi:hypothetical protein